MNVLIDNEYRIGLTLSREELDSYGITYEELDYRNIQTRKFLWEITEDIRKNHGYNISLSGKLLVEVFRPDEDTVTIYLTSLSEKASDDYSLKQLIKNETQPVVAEFSCFEAMLDAAAWLDDSSESSLFESRGKYRLAIYADKASAEKLTCRLSEFADTVKTSHEEEARCRELWSCLASPLAVLKLRQAFSAD